MKRNIGFVSLGTGGTMGHMTLTTKLADALLQSKKISSFIFSEYEYEHFSNIKNKRIAYINLPRQPHMETVGGCLKYKYKDKLISLIEKNNINILFFSTFFDCEILKYARNKNIKTILISYPLRDSHRKAILTRKYYSFFDKVFTLKDIYEIYKLFPNEKIVSPIPIKFSKKDIKKPKRIEKILVTCGGGGRPSSKIFFKKVKKVIPKILEKYPEIKFTIIRGFSREKINLPKIKIIKWSRNFLNLLVENDLIIAEAGYFTLVDIICLKKAAILIPGERKIDNQELRAISYEEQRCGFTFFSGEEEKVLENYLTFLIENPNEVLELSKNNLSIYEKMFNHERIDKVIKEVL